MNTEFKSAKVSQRGIQGFQATDNDCSWQQVYEYQIGLTPSIQCPCADAHVIVTKSPLMRFLCMLSE